MGTGAGGELPRVETTPIPGLLVVRLAVQGDARGWFKEHWQREKMVAAGLPDFGPVQQNFSFNADRAVARGFHAEPWDKYVAVASGRAYAAWVDMRAGDSFGRSYALELDESVAVFVPHGVANSYQTLTEATTYTYLVNQHWRPDAAYPGFSLGDPALGDPALGEAGTGIDWPIPLAECVLSEKDLAYGPLTPEMAIARQRPLVLGGAGQLGRALAAQFPGAHVVGRDELDLTDPEAVAAWDWRAYDVVLNASAFTDVDGAESPDGRREAWAVNAAVPARLAGLAAEHGFTLVHYSSDYVFDGVDAPDEGWHEGSPLAPLGTYGQSKAAGDLAVAAAGHHYLLRTSWLVSAGSGFVATMARLARDGVSPEVVSDQVGRLTSAEELARATRHLVDSRAPWGTYNVSGGGPVMSWYDVARRIFDLVGRDPDEVRPTTSAEWSARGEAAGKVVAPRPAYSVLDLSKLEATGFTPRDLADSLPGLL